MTLRKATLRDVKAISGLIAHYVSSDELLPRSLTYLYAHIRDFTVAEEAGEVIGCGGLHVLWEDLVEVVSLAVQESRRSQGIGTQILRSLVEEARGMGTDRVFALTYRPTFFRESGFVPIDKETLPHKVWRDCIHCPKFPDCGESAVAYELNGKGKK